ncbi:MAG TPA: hypothetical protein PK264_08505, partial [Hyphomicrobiaceae bacterium]|nr:hypothetical protein [Hyphomicrobiaceae bacterium]
AAVEPPRSGAEQPRESANAESEQRIALIKSIQKELKRVGCSPGAENGRWSASVVKAIENFSRITKMKLDSASPTDDILSALRGRSSRVCPLVCDDDEIVVGNECRPKPAPVVKQKVATPKP